MLNTCGLIVPSSSTRWNWSTLTLTRLNSMLSGRLTVSFSANASLHHIR
nr:MAG TPA: hypothetical protein [Caudoviricetes sp.]